MREEDVERQQTGSCVPIYLCYYLLHLVCLLSMWIIGYLQGVGCHTRMPSYLRYYLLPLIRLLSMWIIGYKGWGAMLACRLADRGAVVISLDYRNFPQGRCEGGEGEGDGRDGGGRDGMCLLP